MYFPEKINKWINKKQEKTVTQTQTDCLVIILFWVKKILKTLDVFEVHYIIIK